MNYLASGFSLSMISSGTDFSLIRTRRLFASEVPSDVHSLIDHPDVAAILSNALGHKVLISHENFSLHRGDTLYVAQYKGTPIPEGSTTLPEGSQLIFIEITIRADGCRGCISTECRNCDRMKWFRGG